jgi:hypothetical protein
MKSSSLTTTAEKPCISLDLTTETPKQINTENATLHFHTFFPCGPPSLLLATNLSLHKTQRIILGHDINTTGLVVITDTIALFRHQQHLRSERRANELSLFGTFGQHLGNGGTVLGIEVCVDFVKEVEGCWI